MYGVLIGCDYYSWLGVGHVKALESLMPFLENDDFMQNRFSILNITTSIGGNNPSIGHNERYKQVMEAIKGFTNAIGGNVAW